MHTRGALFLVLFSLTYVAATPTLLGQAAKPAKSSGGVVPPKWYTNVPKDSVNLVARGKGEGKDQQLAIDRAILAARGEISAAIETRWAELLEAIKREGIVVNDPAVESITLKGSKTSKQKASKSKKVWTAFVLVSYPKSSVPSLLLERVHQNQQWYSQVKDSKAVRQLETAAR